MSEAMHEKLMALLNDDSKTNDQFALLIVAYCLQNPIIHKCFGSIADYTEMLLPQNILADGGFVDMLNHTEFITDSDFASPELIGWLYQFYNAERKDEVFAKKGKYEAEDIAPATQIFTPNWIVKYMVENTVGRIYLDNEPYSELKDKMKYLVEPAEPTPDDAKFLFDDIHALTCADLSCGSGHILNECFDLLYQCYLESGYSRRKAIEDIFRYNLTGVDLDTRAKQLAQFALLVKACQKENSFLDAKVMPRVYDMPRPYREYFASEDELRAAVASFIMGENYDVIDELVDAITLMNDAENLGSIMIFNISERTRNIIVARLAEYEQANFLTDDIRNLIPYMKIILTLTEKYAAIVMNPPYMGGGNMPTILSNYTLVNYTEGKADLMTVFMQVANRKCLQNGLWSMINLPSWMFLPSFEDIRLQLLKQQNIKSLLYFGRGIFGSDFGSVAFTIRNNTNIQIGTYRKLFEVQGSVRSNEEIKNNFFNNCYGRYLMNQREFLKIPSSPIAFWLPTKIINSFSTKVSDFGIAKKGLSTGNNNRFLRLWFEVANDNLSCEATSFEGTAKWYPLNKGGNYRKWYGNNEYVINWYNNGEEIKEFSGSVIRNPQFYLKESLTWTMLSASCFGIRYSKAGKIFEGAGPSLFIEGENIYYVLGFLCSNLGNMTLRALNPTINININDVLNLPLTSDTHNLSEVVRLSKDNVTISMQDWDAHETSWDFVNNELLAVDTDTYIDNIKYQTEKHFKETGEQICIDPAAPRLDNLEWRMEQYKLKWERLFMQLHANEEELNRQFIDIYGLQDELTPDVPLSDITILQQGEINVSGEGISFNEDVIIKQFISYAVGCMMGRYRLGRPGLAIAHPDAKAEEYAPYQYNGGTFEIDDDGIVPLMSANCAFTDNANLRFKHWLALALGQDSLVENLNFVEKCLGKPIDEYFMKDFWKDHKKMYQNRPIYWMFASKKGAFQCIAYMHRMNAYTAERIRTNYLLPHIEWLVQKQQELQSNAANLSTAERRELDTVTKQIAECREYHDRLHVIADKQIAFDLDDGVLVNYAKFGDVVTKLK
jgi:hypothetical protein